jgi:hypothetical protein
MKTNKIDLENSNYTHEELEQAIIDLVAKIYDMEKSSYGYSPIDKSVNRLRRFVHELTKLKIVAIINKLYKLQSIISKFKTVGIKLRLSYMTENDIIITELMKIERIGDSDLIFNCSMIDKGDCLISDYVIYDRVVNLDLSGLNFKMQGDSTIDEICRGLVNIEKGLGELRIDDHTIDNLSNELYDRYCTNIIYNGDTIWTNVANMINVMYLIEYKTKRYIWSGFNYTIDTVEKSRILIKDIFDSSPMEYTPELENQFKEVVSKSAKLLQYTPNQLRQLHKIPDTTYSQYFNLITTLEETLETIYNSY